MKNNFKWTIKLNANSNVEIILKLTTKLPESISVNLSINYCNLMFGMYINE